MNNAFHSRLMDGHKVVSIDSLGSSKLTPYAQKKTRDKFRRFRGYSGYRRRALNVIVHILTRERQSEL